MFILFCSIMVSQVYAISASDIKKQYQNNKKVIDTLDEKQANEWYKVLQNYDTQMRAPIITDSGAMIPNTYPDREKVEEILEAIAQRKQDIQAEKDKEDNKNKTEEQKKEENAKLKKYKVEEIRKYLIDHGASNLSEDVKEQWKKTIEKAVKDGEISEKQGEMDLERLDGQTIQDINDTGKNNDTSVYKQPEVDRKKTAAGSLADVIADGKSFLYNGNELQYDETSLQNFSTAMYNILLAIAVAIALIVGVIVGIKYMVGSVEEKANYKAMLIPYVAGCAVVFGAFGIWKLVVTILESI